MADELLRPVLRHAQGRACELLPALAHSLLRLQLRHADAPEGKRDTGAHAVVPQLLQSPPLTGLHHESRLAWQHARLAELRHLDHAPAGRDEIDRGDIVEDAEGRRSEHDSGSRPLGLKVQHVRALRSQLDGQREGHDAVSPAGAHGPPGGEARLLGARSLQGVPPPAQLLQEGWPRHAGRRVAEARDAHAHWLVPRRRPELSHQLDAHQEHLPHVSHLGRLELHGGAGGPRLGHDDAGGPGLRGRLVGQQRRGARAGPRGGAVEEREKVRRPHLVAEDAAGQIREGQLDLGRVVEHVLPRQLQELEPHDDKGLQLHQRRRAAPAQYLGHPVRALEEDAHRLVQHRLRRGAGLRRGEVLARLVHDERAYHREVEAWYGT
mmetsp:Transcript_56202/g.171179  ORF Transcript_56202/g.171179 Transcript_56202/m.171179 type:complete len:379 (+) Transcript_56202:2442-3578(+)